MSDRLFELLPAFLRLRLKNVRKRLPAYDPLAQA